MAFAKANMVLMAHGNNVKLYSYESTADTLATIEAADYFDGFGDQLRVGDVLMVKGSDGSRMYTFSTAASRWDSSIGLVRKFSAPWRIASTAFSISLSPVSMITIGRFGRSSSNTLRPLMSGMWRSNTVTSGDTLWKVLIPSRPVRAENV